MSGSLLDPFASTVALVQPSGEGGGTSPNLAFVKNPTLVVLEGPRIGAYFRFDNDARATYAGRQEAAGVDFVLADASVSRKHARFFIANEDDQVSLFVEDNESTNGVRVNGKPVHRQRLSNGDKIRLGEVLLRYDLLDDTELKYQAELRRLMEAGEQDPLTGCLTRRALEPLIEGLLEAHDAGGPAPVCILVDLDHFKSINDQYGHGTGDEALASTGDILREALRSDDRVCRWGGEEFLIVLPGRDGGNAPDIAARIGEDFRSLKLEGAPEHTLTASMGLASRLPDETTLDWIGRADEALYAAKDAGRDCIRLATHRGPAVP